MGNGEVAGISTVTLAGCGAELDLAFGEEDGLVEVVTSTVTLAGCDAELDLAFGEGDGLAKSVSTDRGSRD